MMWEDYEERKVDLWVDPAARRGVSTARVRAARQPFETAVQHPEYNEGRIVIVEAYDTIEQARVGHAKWVGVMRDGPLPPALMDCGNSFVAQFLELVLGPQGAVHPRTPGGVTGSSS